MENKTKLKVELSTNELILIRNSLIKEAKELLEDDYFANKPYSDSKLKMVGNYNDLSDKISTYISSSIPTKKAKMDLEKLEKINIITGIEPVMPNI